MQIKPPLNTKPHKKFTLGIIFKRYASSRLHAFGQVKVWKNHQKTLLGVPIPRERDSSQKNSSKCKNSDDVAWGLLHGYEVINMQGNHAPSISMNAFVEGMLAA